MTFIHSRDTPGFGAGFPASGSGGAMPPSQLQVNTDLSLRRRAQEKDPSGCRTCEDWYNVILVLLFGVSFFFLTPGSKDLGQHGFLVWKS